MDPFFCDVALGATGDVDVAELDKYRIDEVSGSLMVLNMIISNSYLADNMDVEPEIGKS